MTAIMGKTYLNKADQEMLYRLGAVASTLTDIDEELTKVGRRTKEVRTALTNVNKQIDSMIKGLDRQTYAK